MFATPKDVRALLVELRKTQAPPARAPLNVGAMSSAGHLPVHFPPPAHGRVDPGETPEQGAIREAQEELHVTPIGVRKAGELAFQFRDGYSLRLRR